MYKRVLVTGAAGFFGRAVCEDLQKYGHIIFRNYRKSMDKRLDGDLVCDLKDISSANISSRKIDVVVHCAGQVPLLNSRHSSYHQENVECTKTLLKNATKAGVKRFIFISSLSVYEGISENVGVVTATTRPRPKSPYAISKLEAERAIIAHAEKSDLEFVIIRPPLIYGPGVKGNFKHLIKWIRMALPLPLENFVQPRSFVSTYNLVSLITVCLSHEKAPGNIFLASDDDDKSILQVAETIGVASGKRVVLIRFPIKFMKLLFSVSGQEHLFDRISKGVRVDPSYAKQVLGWSPIESFEQSIKKMLSR